MGGEAEVSNQEILTKAINKAIAGGWNIYDFFGAPGEGTQWEVNGLGTITLPYKRGGGDAAALERYIYNHDFAKALWGDKYVYRADCIESPEEGAAGFQEDYTAWEFHLREMVIAEDPIAYLGEHI